MPRLLKKLSSKILQRNKKQRLESKDTQELDDPTTRSSRAATSDIYRTVTTITTNTSVPLEFLPTGLRRESNTTGLSLGGPRQMLKPSQKRFGEDVAERNIDLAMKYKAAQRTSLSSEKPLPPVPTAAVAEAHTRSDNRDELREIAARELYLPPISPPTMPPEKRKDSLPGRKPPSDDEQFSVRRKPIPGSFPGDDRSSSTSTSWLSNHDGQQDQVSKHERLAAQLEGVVDLRKTEDTTYYTKVAPAVTHEVVHSEVRHVRHEAVTRNIHTHDVHHRILPIKDVEVLPARHFVEQGDGGFKEVDASAIPGWSDTEVALRKQIMQSRSSDSVPRTRQPRRFTARKFPGSEGDAVNWIDQDGVERSITTWVHPPTIDDGARKAGQTVPLHIPDTKRIKGPRPMPRRLQIYDPNDDGVAEDLVDELDRMELRLDQMELRARRRRPSPQARRSYSSVGSGQSIGHTRERSEG